MCHTSTFVCPVVWGDGKQPQALITYWSPVALTWQSAHWTLSVTWRGQNTFLQLNIWTWRPRLCKLSYILGGLFQPLEWTQPSAIGRHNLPTTQHNRGDCERKLICGGKEWPEQTMSPRKTCQRFWLKRRTHFPSLQQLLWQRTCRHYSYRCRTTGYRIPLSTILRM